MLYGKSRADQIDGVRGPLEVLPSPERTPGGTVAQRIGELNPDGESYHQVGYVVLAPSEAAQLARDLLREAGLDSLAKDISEAIS